MLLSPSFIIILIKGIQECRKRGCHQALRSDVLNEHSQTFVNFLAARIQVLLLNTVK